MASGDRYIEWKTTTGVLVANLQTELHAMSGDFYTVTFVLYDVATSSYTLVGWKWSIRP